MTAVQDQQRDLQLRRGDRVRLKSAEDIAATLDAEGRTDALPFMTELWGFAGRELTVAARADKTCDTVDMTGMNRKMTRTVHLEGARCDGGGHGGCQAFCLLFFKEDWLERVEGAESDDGTDPVDGTEPVTAMEPPPAVMARLDDFAHAGENVYRCQATELLRASSPLAGHSHYVDDLRTRNVPLSKFIKGIAFALLNRYQQASQRLPRAVRLFDGRRIPRVRGRVVDGQWPMTEPLNLEPGDLVEVRSREEIEATLDGSQKNRGLWFDEEMLAHCGRRGRVHHRVERLVDEKSGRMLTVKKDLVVVEGMIGCAGVYHSLCPRSFIAMWREAWLRRVE